MPQNHGARYPLISCSAHQIVRRFLFTLSLFLLLFTTLLGDWAFPLSYAYASSHPHATPVPGNLTLQKFLSEGRPDHVYHGPFIHPKYPKQAPTDTRHPSSLNMAHLPPSAQPAKMKPISQAMDTAFLTGALTSKPLDLVGSDQRLEVHVPPGAFDLSHATTATGTPVTGTLAPTPTTTGTHTTGSVTPTSTATGTPVISTVTPTPTGTPVTGPVTLSLTQQYGLFPGQINLLGSYDLEVTDRTGHPLSGVRLRRPITYVFHYQPADLAFFDLDPGHLVLTFPVLIRAARSAHHPIGDLIVPLHNDPLAHTLSGQSTAVGTLDLGGNSANQSPPVPHQASVGGNSGQFSYSYPLTLAPGPGVPQLDLTYSSQSSNERHSITSPGGNVGEGWSLSMGSISADIYSSQAAGGAATWYSLNGAGVSDRLVPNSTDPNSFLTQHISPLKIQKVTSSFGQTCFNVWDASGNEYIFGCTTDSLQYSTDSTGTRTNYRWDLNSILYASEGPGSAGVGRVDVSYLQDKTTPGGYTTIRDAAIQQIITKNASGTVVSTVDFLYRAPFTYSSNGISWATAYGNNYNCTAIPNHPVPNPATTKRCDDPVDFSGGLNASPVQNTFSLQNMWNHAGAESASLAYRYDFQYTDHPYYSCWDDWTQTQEYCAGDHLLTSVTPNVYLKNTAYPRKGLSLTYNEETDEYIDTSQQVPSQPSQYYHVFTYWSYLIGYMDTDTAEGGSVSYQAAYENTHGSPATSDDNRLDPFYCPKHAGNSLLDCSGIFAYPQDHAWTAQVVTSITSSGSDSSTVGSATTSYAYGLRVTNNVCPNFQGDTRCVGDHWLPPSSSDFLNYYQGEFHGFGNVNITSPSGDLIAQTYYSNDKWGTLADSFNNYLSGALYEEQVYSGNSTSGPLLSDTVNTYAGTISGENASCNGNYSGLYTPCAVLPLISKTTFPDGNTSLSAPWVEQDNTFDDYANVSGASLGAGYNNLLQQVIKSSNAPTLTKKWTYTTNDQTVSGWVYHDVNKVTHSEVDDSTGKVRSCQDTSYDQGVANVGTQPPTPAQGLPTTVKTYSDCANQSATAITTYAGYDGNGRAVAHVDGVGAANPGFYGSTGTANKNGCTLASAPAVFPTAWGKTNYTGCTAYDATTAQPTNVANAFNQTASAIYDTSQDGLPTSRTDANGQKTTLAYSFDAKGNSTVQASLPGESNGYTTQSLTNSNNCPSSIPTSLHLPCYEIDSNASQYTQAITHTFYDAQGRAVETRSPGLDAAHDTIVFTVYNDGKHTTFQSVPFEVAHGSDWVDPGSSSTIDPGTGKAPTGTGTFYDALGRVTAVQDPAYGSGGDGISCTATLSGTYTACTNYNLGIASGSGDTNVYAMVTAVDPNKHVSVSYTDALGRALYEQKDSGLYGSTLTSNQLKSVQYNVLNEPTQVVVTDQAPQANQTTTSVTTTAQYDSLGRVTQLSDPDRGTHTATYDTNGNLLTDISGNRTLGLNYDLLGRAGCLQDATPTINATGACSGGHALVRNTYDVSAPGVTWPATDYPIGRLTQSVATTYYPDASSASVTQSGEYDQRGRPITLQMSMTLPSGWNVSTALPTYQMALGYNDANQLTTTTTSTLNPTATGYTTSQVYDSTTGVQTGLSNNSTAIANLASLSFNSNALVSDINFFTSTDTTTPTLANEHFTYDGNLRPSEATANWLSGSCSSGQIFDQSRWFDPSSNVVSLATTFGAVGASTSEVQNFCYDEQSRLLWAGNTSAPPSAGNGTCGSQTPNSGLYGAGYTNSFVSTHLGQLWQAPLNGSSTSYQYLYCENGPHQLTGLYPTGATCGNKSNSAYTSSYDAWGNVTSHTYQGKTATLSYDTLDHLTKWSNGSGSDEQYIYDAGGNRVLRRSTSGGMTTMTSYAFGVEEHQYDGTGVNQGKDTYYYSLGGRLIGELTGSPSKTSIFLTDALGSVVSTFSNTAGSAAVLGSQVYGPYGTQRYTTGNIGTTKGFTGQYNDSVTGLDYYNARYYDPVAGVFLSADTMQGNGSGMNPYGYVAGNPETLSDPTGQRFAPPPCGPDGCNGGGGSSVGGAVGGGRSVGGAVGGGGGIAPPFWRGYLLPFLKKSTTRNSYITHGVTDVTNLSPCGGFSSADCLKANWAAQTQVHGHVVVSRPISGGINVGQPVCLGMGMMSMCTTMSGPSIGITAPTVIQMSGNMVTPMEGCATLFACMAQDEGGGGEKPVDGLKNCVVSRRGQRSPRSAGNVPLERCTQGRECWLTTHRPTRWRCSPSCMCGSTMTTIWWI